jgi:hypothetical protein
MIKPLLCLVMLLGCASATIETDPIRGQVAPETLDETTQITEPTQEVVAADGTLLEVPQYLAPYILTLEAKQNLIHQANQVADEAKAMALEMSEAVPASPPQTCEAATEAYSEWLAGSLIGEEQGSRVNVRPEPDLTSSDGSYGLVGDSIGVISRLVTADCQIWYKVWFPESGWQGWVRDEFIEIRHGQ